MKPVLVLQHLSGDGPSFLATWLAERGVVMDLRCTESGDSFPSDLSGHAALSVMGGAMSANDPLPGLRQAEALILDAMSRQVPVIGHCLGGQLMARALGARVAASPRPEVGWHAVDWLPAAAGWFGDTVLQPHPPEVFQWHFEAFDLPDSPELPVGAQRLAGNTACPNQAFAIGPHLAMQFHVELDAAKLAWWTRTLDADFHAARQAQPRQVQSAETMQRHAAQRIAAQQALAAAAYHRWLLSAAV